MPIIPDKKIDAVSFLAEKKTEGIEFHFHSRFAPGWSDEDFQRIEAYNNDPNREAKLLRNSKEYSGVEIIPLKRDFQAIESFSLVTALLNRRSNLPFTGNAMTFAQLSQLLLLSYGRLPGAEEILRTAPSAGARRPIEIYPVALNVEGLQTGIYHYNSGREGLVPLRIMPRDELLTLIRVCGFEWSDLVERTSVILIMTAVFNRTIEKYGLRGWRFIYEDAGHIGQNIGLVATALNISHRIFGGGYDAEIARTLDLNEVKEGLVLSYMISGPMDTVVK